MNKTLVNEGPRWLMIILWLAGNIGMFTYSFLKFHNSKEYYYLNVITGANLPAARGSAACLNLNSMLILFPICRNFLNFIRGSFVCKAVRRTFDDNILYHKLCAYMICLQTAIHVVSHCFNLQRFVQSYDSPDPKKRDLLLALSQLPINNTSDGYINPVRSAHSNPIYEMFIMLPGVSGAIITFALIIMFTSSTHLIRRSYFEVFWITHHLYIIYFIGLIVHGFQGVVRKQSNIDEHDPELCATLYNDWGNKDPCLAYPKFSSSPAQSWKWILLPVIIYLIECLISLIRSNQKVKIVKVVKHPSQTYQLQMKQAGGFRMSPGQYIFLKCPSVSKLEWHPFTLTSAPQDDFFSVHIRTVGDWTRDLAKACHVEDPGEAISTGLPDMAVDGPYGTPIKDVFCYDVDIFIGTGIGVTPFASVLRYICKEIEKQNFKEVLKKVYFFWICPQTQAFECFQELLVSLEIMLEKMNQNEFLSYNIYLTRGLNKSQIGNIALHFGDNIDPITRLREKTHFGRPRWSNIFKEIKDAHLGKSIGVFYCGPSQLSKTLREMCNTHSDSITDKGMRTQFFFNKESF
ncbi:cytochrome b-245 heavy chain-like [Octopus vulgaris]|uniref:Cytochrome b-245 heavy chain-like n=1 Tax=Octopus vulgaris TaxID=6645 RepID=A0AA36BQA2_OCTVU|nr:cytochrome b-245 heavy chain-like [Octopus vulgaris]